MNTKNAKENGGEVRRVLLCAPCCAKCPELFEDPAASSEKAIGIRDDFGSAVAMSKDQLRAFVDQAKAGKLDTFL